MASETFCDTCGAANQLGQRFCFACGQPLTPTHISQKATNTPTGLLAPQSLLKQRYRILHTIGSGGMGAVYEAEDSELGNRLVAIKEMSQQKLSAQGITDAAANFKQEAHLLARLRHPNLPSIHDYFTEGGRWYLVMDFIPGETLQAYLTQQGGKLPLTEVLQIGIVLCSVLDYLHSQHPPIIFRDLKPSNIMRTPEGEIFLIDFGIARHFKPGQARDTAAFGSAGYAAPEQYGRSQTTPRSDMYSLGCVLYLMLSGRSPSLTPFNLPPLQSLNPSLSTPLVDLITSMTSMDEKQRPSSMRIVKQELLYLSSPTSAVSNAHTAATVPIPPLLPQPNLAPTLSAQSSRRAPFSRRPASPLRTLILRQANKMLQAGKKIPAKFPKFPPQPAAPNPILSPAAAAANRFRPRAFAPPPATPRPQISLFSPLTLWSKHSRMLLTVLLGTLLSILLMLWLDRGTFPTWYQFVIGPVPFRISLFFVLDMLTLLLALYFGVSWGPWAGLCVGGLGTLLGDYLSYANGHFGWNWDLRVALVGLLAGLLLRRALGYSRISHTYIYGCCTLAIIIGTAFASYTDLWLQQETFIVATYIFIVYSALSLISCFLLSILGSFLLRLQRRAAIP